MHKKAKPNSTTNITIAVVIKKTSLFPLKQPEWCTNNRQCFHAVKELMTWEAIFGFGMSHRDRRGTRVIKRHRYIFPYR